MKISLLTALLIIASSLLAQPESVLPKLKSIYASQVAWDDAGELNYDQDANVITVKNFSIPVSESTHLKFDKKKGNKVIFAMQNNTAVTDTSDPSIKKAYFEIPFKTKDGAVSFITCFNQLKGNR